MTDETQKKSRSAVTDEAIKNLAALLKKADAVIIGAGSGLSTAAGFTYSGERFRKYFSDFARLYNFDDMYSGGFYPYETPEEFWAYWSRYVYINRYAEGANPLYEKLAAVVGDKDYFVLTTNVDHQFQLAGFDKNRLFYTQGDYGLFQCSVPCHEKTYDNETVIREMFARQKDMRVPTELIPHCPVCGKPMSMNLRADDTFVEDEGWHLAAGRWQKFLREHINSRVLFWELGTGFNTPGIIKFPFWQMTAEWDDARFVTVNMENADVPDKIAERSLCIEGDIAEVLTSLHKLTT